jgi:hypothetical protein
MERDAMHGSDHDRKFRQGLVLCRKGMLEEAADVFRQVVEEGSRDPRHLSYCGLLTATVKNKPRDGLQLCERAVKAGACEPEFILNLVRACEACGLRNRAVEYLRKGLRQTPGHKKMLKKIDQLSPRRKPPLAMVDRDHPVNKQLAIAMAKLRGEYSADGRDQKRKGGRNKAVVGNKKLVRQN